MFEFACIKCGAKRLLPFRYLTRGGTFICDSCGAKVTVTASKPHPGHTVTMRKTYGDATHHDFNITTRDDGVWLFADDDQRSVAEDIENDSDRAAAIIAASILESRIEKAILCRCRNVQDIEKKLSVSGAFGDLDIKIDISAILGLFTKIAYHDLRMIRKIRNDFAHVLSIKDFNSERIKNITRELKLIEEYVGEGEYTKKIGSNVISLATEARPKIWVTRFKERKSDPRQRYLVTVQLFLACLASCEHPAEEIPFI